MKSKWQLKKLDEIAYFNPKETLLKGTIAKKIAMETLIPFCRDVSNYELAPFNGGTKFKNGDTIMARITPCLENGKTSKVSILDDDEIGFGSTEYIVFRAKSETDEDFLYYLITSNKVRDPAIKSMVGSSGRQRVQTDVIANLEIEVPPYNEQKKIGNFLKLIDDKIALNNKINKNLEHQAQMIFSKEFLEITAIPAGWQESSLIGIADYLNGLALQNFRPLINEDELPVLKIKELRQGACDDNSDKCSASIKSDYLVHDGDVIFSWSGSLLVDFWCGGLCALNQHLFKVTSSKFDKWFYFAWTKCYLQKFASIAADKATTMGHIKREELEKAKVLIPSPQDYKKIGALLEPIYEKIISLRIENRKLADLRNHLLPNFMSGKIDVSELNL